MPGGDGPHLHSQAAPGSGICAVGNGDSSFHTSAAIPASAKARSESSTRPGRLAGSVAYSAPLPVWPSGCTRSSITQRSVISPEAVRQGRKEMRLALLPVLAAAAFVVAAAPSAHAFDWRAHKRETIDSLTEDLTCPQLWAGGHATLRVTRHPRARPPRSRTQDMARTAAPCRSRPPGRADAAPAPAPARPGPRRG